jgi:hypothetical protein
VIFWSLFAGTGQAVTNRISASKSAESRENGGFLSSKWSPIKKLSDDEYRELIETKILHVDTDIALIDEKISELRVADEEQKVDKAKDLPSGTETPSA